MILSKTLLRHVRVSLQNRKCNSFQMCALTSTFVVFLKHYLFPLHVVIMVTQSSKVSNTTHLDGHQGVSQTSLNVLLASCGGWRRPFYPASFKLWSQKHCYSVRYKKPGVPWTLFLVSSWWVITGLFERLVRFLQLKKICWLCSVLEPLNLLCDYSESIFWILAKCAAGYILYPT